jgi:hypothetical protein
MSPEKFPRFPLHAIQSADHKSFGVSLDMTAIRPWRAMKKHLDLVPMRVSFGGAVYLAVGAKHESAV